MDSFDKILGIYKRAKVKLGEILSSCEMMDAKSIDCVTGNLKVKNPLGDYPFYMLLETSGSNGKHDEEKLNAFLEEIMSDGTVLDGTVTNEPGRSRVRTFYCNAILLSYRYRKFSVVLQNPCL